MELNEEAKQEIENLIKKLNYCEDEELEQVYELMHRLQERSIWN